MYVPDHPSRTSILQRPWLLALIGWVSIFVGSLVLGNHMVQGTKVMTDFTQDYLAAFALRQHQSIYGPFVNAGIEHIWLLWNKSLYAPYVINNYHPPFLALLFMPLTWLPYEVAVVLWGIFNILLYIWLGTLVLRVLHIDIAKSWRLPAAGAALCWYPLQAHIALGQVSLLLIACVISGWVLLRQERDTLAGGLLGFACMIKLFPGLLLLYLIARRRWRAATSMLVMMLCIGVFILISVGPADTFHYLSVVMPEDVNEYSLMPFNYSFASAVFRLFKEGQWTIPLVLAPRLADALVLFTRVTMLGALVWWLVRLPATHAAEDAGYALACVAMLLLSPISWQHIFPILFLPFGVLIKQMLGSKNLYDGVWLITLAVLFSLPDITLVREAFALFASARLPWYVSIACSLPTFALLLLCYELIRYQRQASTEMVGSVFQATS